MTARVFFDTNVLLYFATDAGRRTALAEQLIIEGGVISVQVLNELVSIARGKLKMSWDEVRAVRDKTLVFCPNPVSLTEEIHRSAVEISARYGFHIYDALILAAAIEAGCSKLLTEDLQHGQMVEGVRIENPFLYPQAP
jgi:predicted nucleic acid-binding protein